MEHLIYAPPIPLARVNEPVLHTTWPPTSTIELLALPTGTAMVPVVPDGAVTFMLKAVEKLLTTSVRRLCCRAGR